jgi:two-component system KDP operon response regulator KdpE
VLVVDDDPQILRAMRATLAAHGFDVATAVSGEAALGVFSRLQPDVVILDLGLPGVDGFEVIKQVRMVSQAPIVVLSARHEEGEKVRALDLGADDYVTKPFGIDELLARVRVTLRHAARSTGDSSTVLRAGGIVIDAERRVVTVDGEEVHLRPTEYELLRVFLTHPGKVLTHRWLLQHVWGPQYGVEGHYLHVYVGALRKKLEGDPHNPRYLLTEPGVGYRFRSEPDSKP